ncbi:CoA transferase [Gammaproteobacteria bacterium]|nr:CoA transferase [Gammaproteobacteria bacterium]MDA8696441.1 CoA transferase [Gammaproteobacteria bacterium]MDA8856829.1 CoA transferase [Gammaproteobacteria bacterium]MDA9044735.1 CoA transferase [Gammaproteobacteria bacterium]MDA9195688.1 CoA transferase [Gammaproteobacteria bacterium]
MKRYFFGTGTMSKPSASQPLAGIKVIELSNMITCSLAAMTMASQGAQVIKVEPPQMGDKMRPLGTQKNGVSGFFHNCNRGKRSLAIDLKSSAGVKAIKELVIRSDVLLHNYRPGVMDKLGLGSEVLRELNPKLIYVAVSGFGTKGPMADLPAFDHVIQGLAGFTDLQSPEKNSFDFIRTFICDKVTAYTVGQAATAALLARATTNEGQHIDISMLHACLAFMWPDGMMHKTLKDKDRFKMSPGSDYFETINYKDGGVAVAPLTNDHWKALLPMLGYPELLGTPLYASIASRMTNMDQVTKVLRTPRNDIGVKKAIEVLSAADVPCAPCTKRKDLEGVEQIQAIGALETYVTKTMGELTVTTPPILFEGKSTSQAEPSPLLGEHSEEILEELGWESPLIDSLVESGDLLITKL